MKLSVLIAMITLALFGGFDLWLWRHHHSPASTLVAVGALGVACFAQFQASRSAHNSARAYALAELNEYRAKYNWLITTHADADRYVLRNTGTVTARDVRFINVDPQTHLYFEQHEGDYGPSIAPGHAVAFHARFTYGSPGNAVEIDWLPDGETERKSFKDVLDDIPNKTFDETVKRREVERDTEAAAHRAWCSETRKLLIELAYAWGDFTTKETNQNKMRVQAIVSALPSNMVRAIGSAVDVPRDFWGEHQWPLENFAHAKDRNLVREAAPMIELIWNLTWVQIPVLQESDLSQPPDPWYRIEHAVNGYVQMVRNREQGKTEFRDGERDRKHHEDAQRMFKDYEAMFNRGTPQQDESPEGALRQEPDRSGER